MQAGAVSGLPPLPLAGKRIVVTRARNQASSLVASLVDLGASVIELPTIEIVPLDSYEVLDKGLQRLSEYQWLIVTSANTVRVLVERWAVLGIKPSSLAGVRVAAVGSATERALREQGIEVDVVPEQYLAESLVAALGDRVDGARVLLARASVARDVIPEELGRRGAVVDVIDAYKTVIPGGAVDRLCEAFSVPNCVPDFVTFTSSSTVKNFLALWAEAGLGLIPKGLRAISIGPITSATLEQIGWHPEAEAGDSRCRGACRSLS